MTLTSDEVNFLIYRYLIESGFVHSAFTFGHESHVAKSKIGGSEVPPGALISFVQKGLQYTEIESHVNEDGTETQCDQPFSVVTRHQCQIKSKIKLFDPDVPMDEDYGSLEISKDAVQSLKGHTDVVFAAAYQPQGSILISVSQDNSARLWSLDSPDTFEAPCGQLLRNPSQSKSGVLLVQWSPDGMMFATGALDGQCCVWSSKGDPLAVFSGHSGPITALRWNKASQMLLTSSMDRTCIVWTSSSTVPIQRFAFHSSPVLGCDWKSDTVFASCSADMSILICEIGQERPLKTLTGHSGDVNCVKWNPDSSLLASCSDDGTVKVWSLTSEQPVCDLVGHGRDVCTLDWAVISYEGRPTPIIASASFDSTVRIWNIVSGICLFVLSKHLHPVTSLAFSPNGGEYLACGSNDRLFVWSSNDGTLLRTHKAKGGVSNVCWNAVADRIALPCANNTLLNVQFRP